MLYGIYKGQRGICNFKVQTGKNKVFYIKVNQLYNYMCMTQAYSNPILQSYLPPLINICLPCMTIISG